MQRVLVLGGGFGGIAAAIALRRELDEADEVVLVEIRSTFVMGLRKNWGLLEAGAIAAGRRSLDRLSARGNQVVNGSVDAIIRRTEPRPSKGAWLDADALIVALGAECDPDRIPGFYEHALDIYDANATDRNRAAIERSAGGRLFIGIFGAPYPPLLLAYRP